MKRTYAFDENGSGKVPDFEAIARSTYAGKSILVTGAGGSIGSCFVPDLIRLAPSKIAALDRDENGIYELEQDLCLRRLPLQIESYIADVRDACRLGAICQGFSPQIVFHAAAYKHIPLMELHPCEAVLTNVVGTMNMLDVVAGFGAERFIFISTTEAGHPVGVMGATKRIGEMLVRAAAKSGRIRAASVRLGNVMGTSGSVVPLFQKQIAGGGPVTITHPDMVRSFITMKQAIELILFAGSEAQNGEIYLSDLGRPRSIQELAREMILLSGLEPGKDIQIEIIGLRPGEKLNEELKLPSEKKLKTRFDGLSVIEPPSIDDRFLMSQIARLVQSARNADRNGIYAVLSGMGLGFTQVRARSAPELEQVNSKRLAEYPETTRSPRSGVPGKLSRGAASGS